MASARKTLTSGRVKQNSSVTAEDNEGGVRAPWSDDSDRDGANKKSYYANKQPATEPPARGVWATGEDEEEDEEESSPHANERQEITTGEIQNRIDALMPIAESKKNSCSISLLRKEKNGKNKDKTN